MKTYDPNIRWAKHTVEITYQQWEYTMKYSVELKGNVKGSEIMKYAIEQHAETILGQLDENPRLELTMYKQNEDGEIDTLLCGVADGASDGYDDDDPDVEDWLSKMCVGLKIIKHVPQD